MATEKFVTVIPATINPRTRMPNEPTRRRKVAGYARVSTDSDEQLTSYEAQIDYYTNYIMRNPDWQFVKVYTDEGITGTNTKHRDGFNSMISDAVDGKIDLIVTKSVSRFARNTVDSLSTIRMLKEKNVECFFEKENIYTFDSKGELLLTIMSSLAQEESRSISENVTWGKRKSFADGKVSMPYKNFLGYRKGADGNPEINEDEAKIVRRIYDMYLSGMSLKDICNVLTKDKIPTPSGKDKWQTCTVQSILRNEKYKGSALLQKKYTVDFLTKKQKRNIGEVPQYYVEQSHPAIIDADKWERVQLETARRREGGAYNIFSSRVICADCGSAYGPKVYNSNTKYRKTVWRCNHKYASEGNKGPKCMTPTVTAEEIKEKFLSAVNEVIDMREEILDECRALYFKYTDTSAIDAEINKLTTECELFSDMNRTLIEKNSRTVMDQEKFNEQYRTYVDALDEKNALLDKANKKKLEQLNRAEDISAFMFELRERENIVEEFTTEFWNTMIEKATVQRDGSIVFKFKNAKEVIR